MVAVAAPHDVDVDGNLDNAAAKTNADATKPTVAVRYNDVRDDDVVHNTARVRCNEADKWKLFGSVE